jgi:uncharacterized protein involved in response to NO
MTSRIEEKSAPQGGFAPFEAGFRPFFLGAAVAAAFGAVGWIVVWHGHAGYEPALPPSLWHGHEMLFGFVAAALAGFLLTAVPNWTGRGPYRGKLLMLLFAVWAAGRISAWTVSGTAPGLHAVLDVAFLPLLVTTVAVPILRGAARRNLGIVAVLAALSVANAAMHLEAVGLAQDTARPALRLAIGLVAVLVAVIGGRIIPAFTGSYLRAKGGPELPSPIAALDRLAIGLLATFALVDLVEPAGAVAGAAALAAGIANGVRLLRWGSRHALDEPMVWVLHAGYLWLALAMLLRGVALLSGDIPETMGLHALTLGAFGMMIVGVMTRATLGHTGRPISADRWTVTAFALVGAGTIGRALVGPLLPGAIGIEVTGLSGAAWAAGFLVFALRYGGVLLKRRADGREG